jgi:hypothetical protein
MSYFNSNVVCTSHRVLCNSMYILLPSWASFWFFFFKLCEVYPSYCIHINRLVNNGSIEHLKIIVHTYTLLFTLDIIKNSGLYECNCHVIHLNEHILKECSMSSRRVYRSVCWELVTRDSTAVSSISAYWILLTWKLNIPKCWEYSVRILNYRWL